MRAYSFREPYSAEVFAVLKRLSNSPNPKILDLGCGCGDLTKGLADFAESVDAIDISAEMLAQARTQHRAQKNIHWIESGVETVHLQGAYDLITSAQSFHWMDWQACARRIQTWLKTGAFFAVIERQYGDRPWWNGDFQALIDRYSTNRDFQKYELIEEIRKSGLFSIQGDEWTAPVFFEQSVEDLVESFHSRNGFSRDRMTESEAAAFDLAAARHLSNYAVDDVMKLSAVSRVTWMTPT